MTKSIFSKSMFFIISIGYFSATLFAVTLSPSGIAIEILISCLNFLSISATLYAAQ